MFSLSSQTFQLSDYFAIYIPATLDVDKQIDTSPNVAACQVFLSNLFGGSSTYEAIGSWVSDTKGLVLEPVKVIKAFCPPAAYEANLETVYLYTLQICEDLKQEAVSLETSRNGLCLVSLD